MSLRSWKPSSFLKSYRWCKSQSKVDLRFAYSFKSDTLKPESNPNPQCRSRRFTGERPLLRAGFIGLGMWARGNLIPFLLRDWRVHVVMGADQNPVRLQQAGELFRIPILCTDPAELFSSNEIDAVFISTWHDSHASIASMALKAGKKVFVEKPLALDSGQLKLVTSALEGAHQPFLAVGYNRIHSSLTHLLRGEIEATEGPVSLTALVREPTIPPTHYYYWPREGSRILGNACHWIDYAFYLLLPRMPADLQVIPSLSEEGRDQKILIMRYADGSLVNLVFSSVGESLIGGEECIDIKFAETQYRIQDFKTCLRYKDGKWKKIWRSRADRGWQQEMCDVVDGMISGLPPRSYSEIIASANLVLEARASYEKKGEVRTLSSGLNFPFR
jgi:predicted dehydrogenase